MNNITPEQLERALRIYPENRHLIASEQLKYDLDTVVELQRAWHMFDLPGTLSATQAHVWLNLHDCPYRLLLGISRTSQKADELTDAGTPMTHDHAIKFMSSVMNRLKDEQEYKEKD